MIDIPRIGIYGDSGSTIFDSGGEEVKMSLRVLLVCSSALCSLMMFVGCQDQSASKSGDPPIPVAQPRAPATDSADGRSNRDVTVVGMTFTLPAGWREIELTDAQRSFVDARFEVSTSGEPLTLTVTSAGGGIEANIDRWRGQMELEPGDSPIIEDLDVGGVTATWIDIRGTYRAGMTGGGGGANDNYRMLGVAIPHSPRDIYLKLTGPRPLVAEITDDVRSFAQSARPE